MVADDVNMIADDVKILIIEDDEDTRKLINIILERENYSFYNAADAYEALFLLEEIIPDLIICDILLPKMDGFEFRNIIWQDTDLQLVPFIYLTALTSSEYRIRGFELNADDYITKPFGMDELLVRIQSKLNKYQIYKDLIRFDNLTKVFSRRFIITVLTKELERIKRHKRDVSLAMIDVDNFKVINDKFGHLTGDFVLNALAQFLDIKLRASDYVGRYGGEEFLVVMSEIDKEKAAHALSRVQEVLAKSPFTEHNITISISAGISSAPVDGVDVKTLILKADKALYKAKLLGKNRVEVY